MKFILFTLLAVAVSQAIAQRPPSFFVPGKCASVPALPNFKPALYTGRWYEIQRIDYIFEAGLECVTADYATLNSSYVSVLNQGFNVNTQQPDIINGFAWVTDFSTPNYLTVQLPANIGGVVIQNQSPYNVWETDYENYALVYSCTPNPSDSTKFEVAWILSRKPTLNNSIVNKLVKKLSDNGVDVSRLITIRHDCN